MLADEEIGGAALVRIGTVFAVSELSSDWRGFFVIDLRGMRRGRHPAAGCSQVRGGAGDIGAEVDGAVPSGERLGNLADGLGRQRRGLADENFHCVARNLLRSGLRFGERRGGHHRVAGAT